MCIVKKSLKYIEGHSSFTSRSEAEQFYCSQPLEKQFLPLPLWQDEEHLGMLLLLFAPQFYWDAHFG